MITDLRINEKGELEGKVETPQWDETYYTKDDMVAMLEELRLDIKEIEVAKENTGIRAGECCMKGACIDLIQQKIDELKENKGNE